MQERALESTSLWHNDVAIVRGSGCFRFVSTVTQLSSGPVTADVALFLTFGPSDDDIFNPGASRACVILACSFAAGAVNFAAYQGENPFVARIFTARPSLEMPVADRWDHSPLVCCGRAVSVLLISGKLVWLSWTLAEKGNGISYQRDHVAQEDRHEVGIAATALEMCGHGDRVAVGYSNGSVQLYSKDEASCLIQLRSCNAPVSDVVRVSARSILIVVREAGDRVRLFLAHVLNCKSVAELVASSFLFSLARVEPAVAQTSISPLRPFVCSVAVASSKALYFVPLSAPCALLDAHAVDCKADSSTLPLASVGVGIERVMVFDESVSEVFFVRPGVVHITLANGGGQVIKTY